MVIPLIYDYADKFYDGLARIILNGKHGYIDKNGDIVLMINYDFTNGYSEGLAGVRLNNKWGIIDKNGKEIVSPKYDSVFSFHGGLCKVSLNKKHGYINKLGKEVILPKYDIVDAFFGEGFYEEDFNRVRNFYSKSFYIDKTGKEFREVISTTTNSKYIILLFVNKMADSMKSYTALVPIQSTELVKVGNILKITEKLLSQILLVPFLKKNKKVIYVDSITMNPVFENMEFNGASLFKDGLALIELNDKLGFIDISGKEVVPVIYDNVEGFYRTLNEHTVFDNHVKFSEGLLGVYLNKKWGFVNKKGEEIIPFQFDRVEKFSNGMAKVELNGKVGIH